jgi:hypothetical protein
MSVLIDKPVRKSMVSPNKREVITGCSLNNINDTFAIP